MIPASVYIVTRDCEAWIARTLDSVRDFNEVVILDSGSTDRTWQIAETYPNVRIRHQDWQGYAGQKALALAECTQPWVLNLDGDEELSPDLREEIAAVIAADAVDGLVIPIRDIFMGVPLSRYTRMNAKVRFFRRGKGHYDTGIAVHEGVEVDGRLRQAHGTILHYGEASIEIKVDKINRYSGLRADEKAESRGVIGVKLLFVMPLTFIKSYVFRRNFLNGWRGFIGSMINAFYAFLKEAKIYERRREHRDD